MAKITFPVEAGHIMLFARAIGDTNPVYHDAEAAQKTEAGGIIAPPTFAQAVAQFDPDYPLRWRPGQPWFGSGKTPSGVDNRPSGGGGLHAEQHFEYHRPLRPGDMLTVESQARRDLGTREQTRRQADVPRTHHRVPRSEGRAGGHRAQRRRDHGTSRGTAVKGDRAMALKVSELKVGDTHAERICENLSRTQLVMYCGASGDYNPLHADEVYVTQNRRLSRACSRTAC